MASLLTDIQAQLGQYIQMICALFDVDVDICDADLIRIAGTGKNDRMIGKKLNSGRVSRLVMEAREYRVVKSPLEEETCHGCINQRFCPSYCGMCFPLLYEDTVCGAIHITARSQEAEDDLFRRQAQFALFMGTICDLIALTIRERQDRLLQSYQMALQEKLINVINDGVMILNGNNEVQFINDRCAKVLGCRLPQIQYMTKIRQFSVRPVKAGAQEDLKEYQVTIRGTKMLLAGHTFAVEEAEAGRTDTIFVFYDIRGLHEDLTPVLERYTFDTLIGDSPAFRQTIEQCRAVAYSLAPVLLIGEAGCGKELLARTIHNEGTLRQNQFIPIAQAGAAAQLVEKKVFRDSDYFSGDPSAKNEILADNTLYIDEVSLLGLENQRILWKIIQNSRQHNHRVICATTKPLEALRESGDFYPELYYALADNAILVPPLRQRGQDIVLFARYYLDRANQWTHKKLTFSPAVYQLFLQYRWSGNIRELENTVTYVVERADPDEGELSVEQLPEVVRKKLGEQRRDYNLKDAEKRLILQALNDLGSQSRSKAKVASALGVGTATLYRKLKEYGITQSVRFDEAT